MKNNIFTVKLLDIIIPKIQNNKEEMLPNGIFLVLNWVDQDLKQIFTDSSIMPPSFDREHVKIILYNILCSINFLQSANIIHRDLKPGNLLITDTCGIKICDFGLSRSMPEGYD